MLGYKRAGLPDETNSMAAYGSVMHHSIEAMERMVHEEQVPVKEAAQRAVETFCFYWHPLNIGAICEAVPSDGWLPNSGYMELRARGIECLYAYPEFMQFGMHQVLALEYGFMVPVIGTWDDDLGEPHMLGGTVDRLAIRQKRRQTLVSIEDLKNGSVPKYLRHNLQFTTYVYASLQRPFWVGNRGEEGFGEERGDELFRRYQQAERNGMWIDLKTMKLHDCGPRNAVDFQRLTLAINQYVALIKADIFPLSISGANCKFCPYRKVCGGTGLAVDPEEK